MLYYFHVIPFPLLYSYCTVFILHLFSCCTFFTYCTISFSTFTRCNVFDLHSSPVALFACCTFFLLHFVHVALFPELQPGPLQTFTMRSFATIINKVVKYHYKALHLRYSLGSWLRLYCFHVALFPCSTFSLSHSFHFAVF